MHPRLFDHFMSVGMEVVMGNLVGNIAFYAEQFQGAFTGADGGIEYFADNVIRPCLIEGKGMEAVKGAGDDFNVRVNLAGKADNLQCLFAVINGDDSHAGFFNPGDNEQFMA